MKDKLPQREIISGVDALVFRNKLLSYQHRNAAERVLRAYARGLLEVMRSMPKQKRLQRQNGDEDTGENKGGRR